MKNFLILFLASFLIFSCADKEEKTSAEISYTKAMKLLKDHDYADAAKTFDDINDEFPFSKWAAKGQVMAIYANYKNEELDKVISGADDFIRLNSASIYVPYVLYMKGLTLYNRIPQISRAQDDTRQASLTFRELIARFPNSDYAKDAQEKLSFIDEHLAGWHMSVGRYQITNKNYVGALQNFNEVATRYRLTQQTAEAFFRLYEIYSRIGVTQEAKKAQELLIERYPDNYWTKLAAN